MSFNSAFRALADPTRRDILRMLRDGPLTSGEIAESFPVAWATISRHLAVLREAGLISSERQGQQVVYELETTVMEDVIEHLWTWHAPSRRRPGGQGGGSSPSGARPRRQPREDRT